MTVVSPLETGIKSNWAVLPSHPPCWHSTNEMTNTVYIVEKKFQSKHGSTDEKLESCAFKLDRYNHLISPTGMAVQYTYLCNDWFKKPKYRDVIEYIWKNKCSLYFNTLPLSAIGLTEGKKEHPHRTVLSVAGVFSI